jgi:hypothetical protein
VAGGLLGPPLHERPDGGGSGVQLGHAVALDDVPQPVLRPAVAGAVTELGPGGVRCSLVEHRRGAVGEGSIDDVAVPRHPADVGGAPVDVLVRTEVEDDLVGERHLGEVPAGGVHDALRLGRGARRVEQVEELLAVDRHRGAVRRRVGHQLVPPEVPVRVHLDRRAAAVDHHDVLDAGRAPGEGRVDVDLERARHPPAVAGIGGDDQTGIGVLAPVDDGVGREPAEDHRMGHADPGAGQHGDGQLRDHRHVDGDPVAALQPEAEQHVGEAGDVVEQVGVGDRPRVPRLALPMERDPVAEPGGDMAVEAVLRDVQGAADEPPGEGRLPLQRRVEVLRPGEQLPRLPGPERLRVGVGLVPQGAVPDEGPLDEVLGRREPPVLDVELVDRGSGHRLPLGSSRPSLARAGPGAPGRTCTAQASVLHCAGPAGPLPALEASAEQGVST